MSRTYYIHEANLVLADDAVDQSVNVFYLPPSASHGQMSITVSREPCTAEELRSYANKKMVEAAQTLKGFTLLNQENISIGGEEAVEFSYQWPPPHREPVFQTSAVVKLKSAFLTFTFTTLPSDRDSGLVAWRDFLRAIIFREE